MRSYFITGLGQATGLALNNVFCANLTPSTPVLGMFHGSYGTYLFADLCSRRASESVPAGMGGVVAPIIATAMATNGILFSRFFAILLSIRVVNFFATGFTFHHFERDAPASTDIRLPDRAERIQAPAPTSTNTTTTNPADAPAAPPTKSHKIRGLLSSLKNRTTLIGALFIFSYQGAEVSISGWAVSFLIAQRGGDPRKVGYVTAGFWGGVTLGRFTLAHAAHRVGERVFTLCMIAGAVVFEIVVWRLPSVIGDAGESKYCDASYEVHRRLADEAPVTD